MAYNKYRWYTKGRPNKPLNDDAPLLLKIRNGDLNTAICSMKQKRLELVQNERMS